MIDIFGDRKSNDTIDWGDDWEDSPFSPDYLSQANNNFDSIRRGDLPEDYRDPIRRRRKKTRAPEMFDFLDLQDAPFTKPGESVHAAGKYGANRRIVNDYNLADPIERQRMKGEAKNALAWDATASHEQRKTQMDAVAKAQKFDVTYNYYDHLKRYPYGPTQNHVYDEDERLRFQEDFDFFESTPEARQAIIDELDAQIAPWPSYELTPEDYELAASPITWKVPAAEDVVEMETFDPAPADRSQLGLEERNPGISAAMKKIGDRLSSGPTNEEKTDHKQEASNQYATSMSDAKPDAGKTGTKPPKRTYGVPQDMEADNVKRFTDSILEAYEMGGIDEDFGGDGGKLGVEWRNAAHDGVDEDFSGNDRYPYRDHRGELELVTRDGGTVTDDDGKPIRYSLKDAQNLGWEMQNPYVPPTDDQMKRVYARIAKHFPSKGLMKRIAIHESHQGKHSDTARPLYHGGVFQVDEGTFRETQVQERLAKQRAIVSKEIGRDWSTVTWRELRDDTLLSGFAARLALLRFSERIPPDEAGQAQYWKDYYNTSEGKGTVHAFNQSMNAYWKKHGRTKGGTTN